MKSCVVTPKYVTWLVLKVIYLHSLAVCRIAVLAERQLSITPEALFCVGHPS